MGIVSLVSYIGIAAILVTAIMVAMKKHKNIFMSFFQNFTGILFLFSGWVKAIDPLGTAYKMQDYFSEFQYTFQESAMSFLAPLFPFLSEYSVAFSVFMIVFEMVLGVMLILGFKPKLSAWLFFLLVVFFTILTGFTHLTGYVPQDVNFFDFANWGAFSASNQKVTDCGCFGDFIKLDPSTSFYKDIFLLLPSIFFIWKYKWMHQLMSKNGRWVVVGLSTLLLIVYCISNYVWDLPHIDFRPFKNGRDIAAQKVAEEDAAAAVQILGYKLYNKTSGETKELSEKEYFGALKKGEYSKDDGWNVLEYIKTDPTVKETKISHFDVFDSEDNDVTEEYLESDKYRFMIVSYKSYFDTEEKQKMVSDTTYAKDTLIDPITKDTTYMDRIADIKQKQITVRDYVWDADYKNDFINVVAPLVESAEKDGIETGVVMGGIFGEQVVDFAGELKMNVDYETADEILLKTIVRSNPGIVLWKDGKIVQKWHKDQLPDYADIKAKYIK